VALLLAGCLDVQFGAGGAGAAGGAPTEGGAGALGGAPSSGGSPATGGSAECEKPASPCGSEPCAVELLSTGEDSEEPVRVVGKYVVFGATDPSTGATLLQSLPADAPLTLSSLTTFSDAVLYDDKGRFGDLGGGEFLFSTESQSVRCGFSTADCESLSQPSLQILDALVLSSSSGTRFVWAQGDFIRSIVDPRLPVPALEGFGGIDVGDEVGSLQAFRGERDRVWFSAGEGPLARVTFDSNGVSTETFGGNLVAGVAAVDAGCSPSSASRIYTAVGVPTCGNLGCVQVRWSDMESNGGGPLEPSVDFAQFAYGPTVPSSIPAVFDADRDYVYLALGQGLGVYEASSLFENSDPAFVLGSGTVVSVDASHEEYVFFTTIQGGASFLGRWRKERLSGPATSGSVP
jgi:hypothetical protein